MNKIYIYAGIFCLFLYTLFFNTYMIDDIKIGEIYSMKVTFYKDYGVVEKINRLNISKKLYVSNDKELKFGKYDLIVRVNKIKNKNLDVDILGYKENMFNKYRDYILDIIDKNYRKEKLNAFIKSVIIGDKSGLSSSDKMKYRYLGISHIFAISGLHLSILLMFIKTILYIFSIDKRHKDIIEFILITFYSLIIGFTVSIKRVYFMYTINTLKKFWGFNISRKEIYLYTLIIVLSVNIYSIFDLDFILSFLSTFVIFFIINEVRLNENIILPILIQIFITPFIYYYTKTIPLLSFFANMIILPMVSYIIQLISFSLVLNFIGIDILNNFVLKSYEDFDNMVEILYKIPYMSLICNESNVLLFLTLIIVDFCILIYLIKNKI